MLAETTLLVPLTAHSDANTEAGYVEILIDVSRVWVHGDVALQMRRWFCHKFTSATYSSTYLLDLQRNKIQGLSNKPNH
jgi:hypothetical protein